MYPIICNGSKGLYFSEEDSDKIISDVLDWVVNSDSLMFVDKNKVSKANNIIELFEELRLEIDYIDYKKEYAIWGFIGCNFGEENDIYSIFNILSKYLSDGYIELFSDNEDVYKFIVKEHKFIYEKYN